MAWATGKGRGAKYGHQHRAARKALAALHDPAHPCTRCGRALGPMGPRLHLDHAEDGSYEAAFWANLAEVYPEREDVAA